MSSRPLLLLGNIAAVIVTVAAFFQALSWPIAGVLILVSLVLPLLANISSTRGAPTTDHASKVPATTRHSQTETKTSQHQLQEKHAGPNHQLSTKIDQRQSLKPEPVTSLGPKVGPKLSASTIAAPNLAVANLASTPRPPIVRQGPN